MPDMPLSLSVTRSELSLGDLDIIPANGYRVARHGIGPGALTMMRVTAESPFVHGQTLVHAKKNSVDMSLNIKVEGSSTYDALEKLNTLTDAFTQFEYEVYGEVDGYPFNWLCDCADFEIGDGGQWNELLLMSSIQYVRFTFNRQP